MTGKKIFSITKELKTKTRKRFIPDSYLIQFYHFNFDVPAYKRTQHLFFFSFFCGGINFRDMAKLKTTDIQNDFTKKEEPMKYFIYEREKTHEPIEVALNKDIETKISYRRANFKCPDDYLLPIVTTKEKLYITILQKNGKSLTNTLRRWRRLWNFRRVWQTFPLTSPATASP